MCWFTVSSAPMKHDAVFGSNLPSLFYHTALVTKPCAASWRRLGDQCLPARVLRSQTIISPGPRFAQA